MMTSHYAELMRIVARARARWQILVALRGWSMASAAAALALGLALLVHRLLAPEGWVFILLWGAAAVVVLSCLAWVVVISRRAPDNRQVARYIEECCPEFDDAIATAVVEGEPQEAGPMVALVVEDAVRLARHLDFDRLVRYSMLRRAGLLALAATAALVVISSFAAAPASRAARLLAIYMFPERLGLEVMPGDIKIRAGTPLRIVANIPATFEGITPVLHLRRGDEQRETAMQSADGHFAVTFDRVDEGFRYAVSAAGTTSREYAVTVMHPPHVQRIDLRYVYPAGFRMQPRVEEDGGDIYGPMGTRVRLSIYTDKPVTTASLALTRGQSVSLAPRGDLLEGELTIAEDGSYRVALTDGDGLNNPGDTEYFIRTLVDRPPDVRIVRPATDKEVTPLEEISIEARADDDFGVSAFDLVYSVRGAQEKVMPFQRNGSSTTVDGQRTIYLEDLRVQPGDFVAYYARVRDVSRGKRSSEARSDIFFLEVKPFDGEFVASQSQAMSGAGGGDSSLQTLIEGQKDVITATWKLDRRGRESGGRSPDDIKAVGRAQAELRSRAQASANQLRRSDPNRGRLGRQGSAPGPADDPMSKAVEAMGRAQQQLEALKTETALPPEMMALNELMRAEAEVRRREVQRQQANGSGRGQNRQQQDLSSLFDRELARQQQTNYETPNSKETTEEGGGANDALDKIRELARRQDALNREQKDLANKSQGMSEEELKRQLERLTREQSELRRQAEELSRQMQQGGQNSQGKQGQQSRSGGQPDQAGRALRDASEDMRTAASELRRQDPSRASASGSRALERLQEGERRLSGAQPDDRRRALGELQLESQQLAEEERRLANEPAARGGSTSADTSRRRSAEQERLADRTQRLEQSVRELANGGGNGDEKQRAALTEASREIERQRLSERMRNSARAERQQATNGESGASTRPDSDARNAGRSGSGGTQEKQSVAREQQDIARGLDRLAERLGSATQQNDEARRLGEQLSEVRELRNKLTELDRQLSNLSRQGDQRNTQGKENASERGAARGDGRSGQVEQGQRGQGQGQGQGQRGQSEGSRQADSTDAFGPGGPANGSSAWEQTQALVRELQEREALGIRNEDLEGFHPGLSAPGTEAWKQDFAKWDELKKQLVAALEKAESTTAARLRDQQSRDRLNAGATQAVPEQYRQLVDKYYRALASPSKEQR